VCVGVWKADPTIYARSRKIVFRDFFTATVLLEMFHKSAPLSYYGLRNAGHCKAASLNGCGHFRARPRGSPRGQTSARVCHARCLATRRVLQNAKIGATGRKINVKNIPRRRSQILSLWWAWNHQTRTQSPGTILGTLCPAPWDTRAGRTCAT